MVSFGLAVTFSASDSDALLGHTVKSSVSEKSGTIHRHFRPKQSEAGTHMKVAPKPASDRLQRPTQLPYDELTQFNQHCLAALELIKVFADRKMIRRTENRYWCAMLQELRACVSRP